MKNLVNRVQLVGNLGIDPEIKNLESGKKVAQFSLATSVSTGKGKEKQINTQWHQIVAWGGLATIAENYLEKGKKVAIEGSINYRSYEKKDGQKVFFTEIIASDILMLSPKKQPVDQAA